MKTQNISITLPMWMINRLNKVENRSQFIQQCVADRFQDPDLKDEKKTIKQLMEEAHTHWRKGNPDPISIQEYIQAKNYGRP